MSDSLNIVFLVTGIVKSGGTRVIGRLANGLACRGHRVAIVQPGEADFPFPLVDSVDRICVTARPSAFRPWQRIQEAHALLNAVPRSTDCVVSGYYLTAYPGALAEMYGSRHIYLAQDYEPDFFDSTLAGSIQKAIAAASYILPGQIITISNYLRDRIARYTRRLIPVVPDGVDLVTFCPGSSPRNENLVMTVGRPEKRKGFLDFIAAMEQIWSTRQDFSALIVTSDKQLQVRTCVPHTILHPANDADIAACYQRATMFVSSSHREGFCLPALEAMACGTPLVTTQSGGVGQFVTHRVNALVVPVAQPAELAAAVTKLLGDASLRSRLSAAARSTAIAYGWDAMVSSFERELLASCSRKRVKRAPVTAHL